MSISIRSDRCNLVSGLILSHLALWGRRDIVFGEWKGPKCMCISFDCDYEEDIKACRPLMKLLQSCDVPASFVIPGYLVKAHPNLTEEILDNGYEILNHTFTHPSKFRELNELSMRKEIVAYQTFIEENHNYYPKGFRTPHGLRKFNPGLFKILEENNMYDSSLIGYGVSKLGNVSEIPLTPCPEHRLMAFDTYHHFRFPFFNVSEEKVLYLWSKLIERNSLINIFMDPMDLACQSRLIMTKKMLELGKQKHFKFIKMCDLEASMTV